MSNIITDEMIKEYCKLMNYKLHRIGKIAFDYTKENGEHAANLKASASQYNIDLAKKRNQ